MNALTSDLPWAVPGSNADSVRTASRCFVPVLAGVVVLSALHNQGVPWAGGMAWLLGVASALVFGTRPAGWLAIRRTGWGPAVAGSAGVLLLPALLVAAVVQLRFQALLLHPSVGDGAAFLAVRFASALPLAFAEELLFRGWMQQDVLRTVRHPVTLSAGVFALAHALATGRWILLPVWWVAGLWLGATTRRAGGALGPAILLHAACNVAVAWARLWVSLNLPLLAL